MHGIIRFNYLLMERMWKVSNKTTSYAEIDESKLRDHFAGLAMQGMMTYIPVWNQGTCQADYIANHAYTIADAMLKASKEVKP